MPKKMSAEERIAKYVRPLPDGCWAWVGVIAKDGYGLVSLRRGGKATSMVAHRYVYQHMVGPIPEGMFVCHRCDVRECVNPDHLFIGTHADNMRDMVEKGRHVRPVAGPKLGPADVAALRAYKPAKVGDMRRLAKQYGITPGHLCKVRRGYAWPSTDI